jgi:hypothetical protein
MNLQIFNDPGALVAYVNANGIIQTKIVRIEQRSGKWYLFWYT